jgi:hypothetical protein
MHFAIFHRITLSARANTSGSIVTPICFVVLRLMTNLNFVGYQLVGVGRK